MNRMYRLLVLATLLVTPPVLDAQQNNAVTQLHALFDAAWEQDLQDYPRAASYLGDKRFNAEWGRHSPQAFADRDRQYQEVIASLSRIDRAALPMEEQL
ncbi:MAG TPA: hypothetical protein VNA21_12185, partial [Steroidobacteraceae bacterium]|nr:hypothetical protein [Steroidobacteraceae bacterium]